MFTRPCLKVLIGLKAALTPRGVHTLSNFSLMPLTYSRHRIFSGSVSGGGGSLGVGGKGLMGNRKSYCRIQSESIDLSLFMWMSPFKEFESRLVGKVVSIDNMVWPITK